MSTLPQLCQNCSGPKSLFGEVFQHYRVISARSAGVAAGISGKFRRIQTPR